MTPFGGECHSEWARTVQTELLNGTEPDAVAAEYALNDGPSTDVDIRPQATGLTLRQILTEHVDYLSHEALYVVDRRYNVTAYRTLWFGLQYDSERIETQPTVGFGAVQTVRWHNGQPVGDGYVQGQFAGLKRVVGAMVDRGVFDEREAVEFLKTQLAAVTNGGEELHFGAVETKH